MSKEKIAREELFDKAPIWNAIFSLTIPMIISSVVMMIYNLSDTYFVGALNDPIQNAAITLAAPAMTLFYSVINLFGVGASSLMSRSMGVKDTETVKKAAATGLYFAFFCSVLFSAVTLIFNRQTLRLLGTDSQTYLATKGYLFWTVGLGAVPGIMSQMFSYLLRAEGRSMEASIGQAIGCILNIILDPFFVLPWGLAMGGVGAGLATFIGHCASLIYFFLLLWRLKERTYIRLTPSYFSLERHVLSNIFIVGVPGVFQNALNVVSMTLLNNIVAGYGAAAVAAVGIANRINQLPIQVVFGFTQGVMPLIGYNYASNNRARVKETIKKTYLLTISSLLLVLILFNVAGQPIIRLFMDNNEIAQIGAYFLSGYGFSLPFMCIDFMVVGVSQAFGYGKPALLFSLCRKLCLEMPLIVLLNMGFGVMGIAYAQCLTEVAMACVAFFVQRKLLR